MRIVNIFKTTKLRPVKPGIKWTLYLWQSYKIITDFWGTLYKNNFLKCFLEYRWTPQITKRINWPELLTSLTTGRETEGLCIFNQSLLIARTLSASFVRGPDHRHIIWSKSTTSIEMSNNAVLDIWCQSPQTMSSGDVFISTSVFSYQIHSALWNIFRLICWCFWRRISYSYIWQ